MPILYISQDGDKASGVATYGRLLLTGFADARMLLLNAPASSSGTGENSLSRIHCVPEGESHAVDSIARRLVDLVQELNGDVIVLPNTGDTPWNATLEMMRRLGDRERSRVRVLGIVHSDVETQYALAERFLPIAPVWIGVSRRCAEELRRRVGPLGARVHELPYPIEIPCGVRSQPKDSPILRMAYVGRLEEPQKRISRLVEVFSHLHEAGVDFRAAIAGDGPARNTFAASLARSGNGVQERVTLLGSLDRVGVERLWKEHDICLLTSVYEGMPIAVLEAMAAGVCPVVMAVDSGLPELIQDGVNGRVVPQGDVAEMARIIGELGRDREQLRRLALAAHDSVAMRFSPDAHFNRLNEIIDELWSMPPPNPFAVSPDPTTAAVEAIAYQAKAVAKPVSIFGAGMFGRKVVDACRAAGVEVSALYDSDPAREGTVYAGLTCRNPAGMSEKDVVVAIGSLQFASEMREQVASLCATRGLSSPTIISVPRSP